MKPKSETANPDFLAWHKEMVRLKQARDALKTEEAIKAFQDHIFNRADYMRAASEARQQKRDEE